MSSDGGLRPLFQQRLPEFHWQAIETGSTGRGIPDLNWCTDGIEGWLELKQTQANKVEVRPEQVAWIERRIRAGGRVFIAVRYKHAGGPRKGDPVDRLYLYKGSQVRNLLQYGISHTLEAGAWAEGPAKWDWLEVRKLLIATT